MNFPIQVKIQDLVCGFVVLLLLLMAFFFFFVYVSSNRKFEENLISVLSATQETALTFQLKITCRQLLIYPYPIYLSLM